MAKKNNPNAVSVAATKVGGTPALMQQGLPQINLDLKIGIDDLVNIGVTERADELVLDREAKERNLAMLMADHTKAQTKLTRLAQKLIDETSVDQAVRELVTRLIDFTGEQHTVKVVNTNASTYRYGQKEDDSEQPEVNLNKLAIIGDIRIVKKGDHEIVARRKVEILFTDTMKDTVVEIERAANLVANAETALLETKRKIADLPRMAQRARSELTKAYLRGELTDTRAMLDTVLATPIKALPMMVGTVVSSGHGEDD